MLLSHCDVNGLSVLDRKFEGEVLALSPTAAFVEMIQKAASAEMMQDML
jgi:hypothetical protein